MPFLKHNAILKALETGVKRTQLIKLGQILNPFLLKKLKIIEKPMHLPLNLQVIKLPMLLIKPY